MRGDGVGTLARCKGSPSRKLAERGGARGRAGWRCHGTFGIPVRHVAGPPPEAWRICGPGLPWGVVAGRELQEGGGEREVA